VTLREADDWELLVFWPVLKSNALAEGEKADAEGAFGMFGSFRFDFPRRSAG
jgi:hypothetical protein